MSNVWSKQFIFSSSSFNILFRNGGFSNSENKWFIPFLGADPSVVKRTQYYESMVHGRMPVQYFAYFTMPSLVHIICMMLFGLILFVLSKFAFGIKLLEKVFNLIFLKLYLFDVRKIIGCWCRWIRNS